MCSNQLETFQRSYINKFHASMKNGILVNTCTGLLCLLPSTYRFKNIILFCMYLFTNRMLKHLLGADLYATD